MEPSECTAPEDELSLVASLFDQLRNTIPVGVINQRSHLALFFTAWSHADILKGRSDPIRKLALDLLFDKEARGCNANLARHHQRPTGEFTHRLTEIRVGEHNRGGLAAELQRKALQRGCGGCHDPFAGRARAGKRYHVNLS